MARALVTGGSRGIGGAIADALQDSGHDVWAPSRSVGFDLKVRYAAAYELYQPYDILIHNVGGGGRFGDPEDVMYFNFWLPFAYTERALPSMVERGWGRVIAINSIFGAREVGPPRPIFHAAKAAQAAWMKSMSKNPEYVRCGITFNTVCPGNVLVEGKPRVDEQALPMGRMGRPEEVAKLVAFLCSEDAAWINGSTITIDGGESNAL